MQVLVDILSQNKFQLLMILGMSLMKSRTIQSVLMPTLKEFVIEERRRKECNDIAAPNRHLAIRCVTTKVQSDIVVSEMLRD